MDQETAKAKAYMAKDNKKAAMMCLKQKKMYTAEVERLQNIVLNMQQQKSELESMSMMAEAFEAQRFATEHQKKLAKKTNVEEVEKMQEDLSDVRQQHEEVAQALGDTSYGITSDDMELEEELNGLMEEEATKEILEAPSAPTSVLPNAPIAAPAETTTVDEELEALQREMGLAA